uniref:Zinc finger protein 79 n=1 Tax=Molossus molossus TaxID=27622 RepID=A0A7J8EHT9_MOLMO|nr:zinc finger protein 79 [Molossus molossus]
MSREPPSPHPTLSQEQSAREEGMVAGLLTVGPHGSTPFGNVTVAFTHKEWRHLVPAPRDRFEEEIPEKSRNLVLLGLPVSQPGMNSQLEQGESPWMLEGEGLRTTCPEVICNQIHRDSLNQKRGLLCSRLIGH